MPRMGGWIQQDAGRCWCFSNLMGLHSILHSMLGRAEIEKDQGVMRTAKQNPFGWLVSLVKECLITVHFCRSGILSEGQLRVDP